MSVAGQPAAAPPARAGLSKGYVSYALTLLLVIYTLNFVDRQIVSILGEDIKRDLKIDDTAFGLLGGPAFALFYTVLGIPIARFAERANRVTIISAAVATWSAFTALCGVATGFAQMLAFRIGVGVGEAGCTPPAHALISDYVPPEKRASALAFYSLGVPVGTFAGFAVGAAVAAQFGWRTAFLAVGIPGVIIALVARFTLKEPRSLGLAPTAPAQGASFGSALATLSARPSYWWLSLAATFVSFLGYGHAYFLPAYLARVHGMSLQERGFGMAVMVLIAGGIGTWLGGVLADAGAKRDARAYATLPVIALIAGGPFFYAGMLMAKGTVAIGGMSFASGFVALAFLAAPTALNSIWYGPVYAAVQNLFPAHVRATAVAVMFFIINLVGLGLGPLVVGALSDVFAAQHFGALDTASFTAACPAASKDAACALARAEGVRQSLIVTSAVGLLAIFSFLMARVSLRKDLAASQAAGVN